MARERVQVQGLGDVAPGIQPTIQRAGQYGIQMQRAGRNKLMDLADALGQVNPALQAYGQVQKFQYEKGLERGEMEAATADLEASIEGLDVTGEKLVEQGLLPRSQLVGYQRAFRRRIGQRQARTTYMNALNSRMEEVTQNLDSDADIIENILAEERQKITEQLGGSQFAMQGFADYSESIENSFYNNAVKQRDRATQEYNESLVIEGANQDFGDRVLTATDPKEVAQLQLDIKNQMDAIAEEGRIPRSRVIELYWNGFAVPNINNLLVSDNPQPDKAEKMLDALLDIDLTGKGGKLGNINREGAYIRSKAVELRNKIEGARRSIEKDEDIKAGDIVDLYMPAATTVMSGLSKNEDIAQMQISEVVDFLKDAGWDDAYANKRAMELINSQDVGALRLEGLKYRENDVTKGAWNAATGSIQAFTIGLVQKANAVMSRDEREAVLEDVSDLLAKDPEADVNKALAAQGVTDPRVKADVIAMSQEAKANLWFEKTETFKDFDREFEGSLDEVVDVTLFSDEEPEVRESLRKASRSTFQEQYRNELRDVQKALKNDPDRDIKITQEAQRIKKEVSGRWLEFKTLEKKFREGRLKEIAEEEPGEYQPPELPELEEATEKIDSVLISWRDSLFTSLSTALGMPEVGETVRARREFLQSDIPIRSKDRSKAFVKADYIKQQLAGDYKDNQALQEGLLTIRHFYGFRNPSEIDQEMVDDLDFRFTPMYDSEDSLIKEATQARAEIIDYLKSPAKLDIDDFPIYKLYNEKFGINTVDQLKAFVLTQKEVLKKRNQ
jgi:hypothetical protein